MNIIECSSNGIDLKMIDSDVWINGEKILFPGKLKKGSQSVTINNGKININGYVYNPDKKCFEKG